MSGVDHKCLFKVKQDSESMRYKARCYESRDEVLVTILGSLIKELLICLLWITSGCFK